MLEGTEPGAVRLLEILLFLVRLAVLLVGHSVGGRLSTTQQRGKALHGAGVLLLALNLLHHDLRRPLDLLGFQHKSRASGSERVRASSSTGQRQRRERTEAVRSCGRRWRRRRKSRRQQKSLQGGIVVMITRRSGNERRRSRSAAGQRGEGVWLMMMSRMRAGRDGGAIGVGRHRHRLRRRRSDGVLESLGFRVRLTLMRRRRKERRQVKVGFRVWARRLPSTGAFDLDPADALA